MLNLYSFFQLLRLSDETLSNYGNQKLDNNSYEVIFMVTSEICISFIIIFFFALIGIQLFRGKWLMLIAGYNTSSKEERKKMNGKNLGKLFACLLFFLCLLLVLQTFNLLSPGIFSLLIFSATIGTFCQ
ncbi:DUF3784 domain-containing protein [Enterococcus sp. DIV1749]|uniref:DUF3784 domain-containing protein n=1 Tax=Enterococcus sp. DIV1749 TaxID=2774914 RepID=UPI00035359B6|nr:hypothetical protein D927_00710 [Enterococcus faecalis 02-MB-BW-10]EPH86531.1 hypothetical protein D924_00582 [Enterococcus faecalis 06-MB-S-10]EPH91454.1 hypothetical protein D923_00886 [Enterococcus faecalis 06-MB-S-04]